MRLDQGYLSKREQQIMEAVYTRDEVTANELCQLLPGQPSNASVRKLLSILEEKGLLLHREEGNRFIYFAATSRQSAAIPALRRLVSTFFRGSVSDSVAAMIRDGDEPLSHEELQRLTELIEEAKAKR